MFQTGSLEGFVGLMTQAAMRAATTFSAAAKSGEYINIEKPIGNLAMQVITSTAFGYVPHIVLNQTCTFMLGSNVKCASCLACFSCSDAIYLLD